MPQSDLHIRPAIRSDLSRIADFQVRLAAETENKALDLETVRRGVRAAFDGRGRYLVGALQPGRPIDGCLMLIDEWSDWHDANYRWVHSVYVDPAARRRGIASGLMETVLEEAIEDGCHSVRLYRERDNRGAEALYRKYGLVDPRYGLMERVLTRSATR